MGETFGFFLAAFITICFARPVAAILKIPTLVVYIVAGILFGPSGLNLVKNVSSLSYFYELGIILLMFSAGLELKITPSRDRTSVSRLFLFNMVIPSLAGFIYGFLISGYAGFDNRLFLSFYMLTLVGSPASEVVVQLFREFTGRMSHVRKKFFSQLIVSSVFSDLVSLFIFTIIFAFHISNELYGILKFFFFASGFFIVVFKGLPLLQEKLLRRLKGINTPEDETTILLMLVVIVVSIGAFLQVPAVVCAFFAGISLANIDINRMVRNNINFISSAIFVPIVFIIIGAKVDLNIFRYLDNFLVAVVTIAVLMLVRIISIYIASRSAMFSIRESLGFGFFSVPQLTGALAIGVVFYDAGLLPEVLFNAVIILCVITTIVSPIMTRVLLFPGIPQQKQRSFIDDFIHYDIKPFGILTSICDIARRLKNTEFSVYPVVDENYLFKGVVHLEDVRDIIFSEDMACLIISADLLDSQYPFIEKDSTVEDAIKIFTKTNLHIIPVVETIDGKPFYTGMLFLQDILPEISYTRS